MSTLENTTQDIDAATDTRRTFIRATEVWTVDPDDNRLKLSSGIYGEMHNFAMVSGEESFAHGEGLPGKAWAEAKPIVLKGFRGSYFKRTEAAEAEGLTAGIAIPVFNGSALQGVVVFLFGDDAEHVGAVEVWNAGPEPGDVLALEDGYFGTADHFAWISRHTRFPRGSGLPGKVWSTEGAVLFRDLGQSHRFIRFESAAESGMTAGLGMPVPSTATDTHVVTLLSALGTPIARRFEIWERADTGDFVFADGITETGENLTANQVLPEMAQGQGLIGQVATSGIPVVASETGTSNLSALVALPVYRDGQIAQIVAWYF